MLVTVKQTESDLGAWLGTEWGFISGVMKYESEPIVLEPFQLAFLQNRSRFRWITKARQVGFSFICALAALAREERADLEDTRPAKKLVTRLVSMARNVSRDIAEGIDTKLAGIPMLTAAPMACKATSGQLATSFSAAGARLIFILGSGVSALCWGALISYVIRSHRYRFTW